MSTKPRTCYSISPDGYFAGETVAHPDQMKPGSYLLPAFATFNAPPSAPGKVAKWNGSMWVLVDPPAPPQDDGPSPEFLAHQRRRAIIEDAARAAASVSRLRDEAVAKGLTPLSPWLEYIDSLIAISRAKPENAPDEIPPPPDTPLWEPPPPPDAPEASQE